MKILVLGGTGFIGSSVFKLAVEKGHEVFLFHRGNKNNTVANSIIGDISNLLEFKEEILSKNFDLAVSFLCNTEKQAQDMVEVFKGTKTNLVIISSMDCYEAFQQANRGKEVSDYPIDETMPTSKIKYYWNEFTNLRLEYDKNLMTDVFMKAQDLVSSVIFRIPAVYGPNDYQYNNRHGEIIKRILDKRDIFPLSATNQGSSMTFGYIDNVSAAIVHSFDKFELVSGKIYNIGETKVRTWRRWCELFATLNYWEFEFYVLPDEVLHESKKLENNISTHLVFDCNLYKNETNFIEPVSLEEGIKRTFNFAKEHNIALKEIDYEKEETLIAKYLAFLNN